MMQLSGRLQKIAEFIPPGDRIIDVGTDHAYIPIWLLLQDPSATAIATDIRSGPLERARADAAYYGVAERLSLRLCDGLTLCAPEEADTVILAGMGGETMIGILTAAPWAREKRLVLQPQTKQDELRAWLGENGYTITDAALAYDTGRLYLIWSVGAGEMPPFSGVDGALLARRDPLLKPWLAEQIKRLRKRLNGVQQARAEKLELTEQLGRELEDLERVYREVETWQV